MGALKVGLDILSCIYQHRECHDIDIPDNLLAIKKVISLLL